ncbi:MMPL family transporter [Streptomyces ziwulingensis]
MAPLTASSVTMTQVRGTVLVVGALVDATVVRCLLVPSAMTLAGSANRWPPFTARRRRTADDPPTGSATLAAPVRRGETN